jgi:predicted  nucleic acid-binding Zn-ribbon protein
MYDLRHDNGPSTDQSKVSEQFTIAKKHTGSWIAIGVLAAGMAGLCWYGSTLRHAPAVLAQFPALQQSFESVNARLAATEAKVKNWDGNQQELEAQVAKLHIEMTSRVRAASKQAQRLNANLYKRLQAEMAAQSQAIATQISQLESASETEQASVEELHTALAALREQAAEQAGELRKVKDELDRAGANHGQQLAALAEQMGSKAREVEELSKKLDVKRVDFEVTRNHTGPLTGEISLSVTGTDVSHRRINGWMWVMPDRRTIWLHGQGAQQPVVFYGYQDGKRRELVITNVTRDSVTGYLLLPGDSDTSLTASVAAAE